MKERPGAGDGAQLVEYLPGMHKARGSSPCTVETGTGWRASLHSQPLGGRGKAFTRFTSLRSSLAAIQQV